MFLSLAIATRVLFSIIELTITISESEKHFVKSDKFHDILFTALTKLVEGFMIRLLN
jgi:hypothetical protein